MTTNKLYRSENFVLTAALLIAGGLFVGALFLAEDVDELDNLLGYWGVFLQSLGVGWVVFQIIEISRQLDLKIEWPLASLGRRLLLCINSLFGCSPKEFAGRATLEASGLLDAVLVEKRIEKFDDLSTEEKLSQLYKLTLSLQKSHNSLSEEHARQVAEIQSATKQVQREIDTQLDEMERGLEKAASIEARYAIYGGLFIVVGLVVAQSSSWVAEVIL